MHPNDKEFDRQMREKLHDFTPGVPAGLWDKIEAGLTTETGGRNKAITPANTLRNHSTWWAAAAAVLMVGMLAYWFNRPVEVIYLQGKTAVPEDVVETPRPIQPRQEVRTHEKSRHIVAVETFFAKKVPGKMRRMETEMPQEETAALKNAKQPIADIQLVTTNEVPGGVRMAQGAVNPTVVDTMETYLVEALDLKPLIDLQGEEVMLASTEQPKNAFGVSRLLNFVVGTVDQRGEKTVTFSNDEEGSLKIDFNFNLAKNRKGK